MLTFQRRGIVDTYNQFFFSRASTAFDSRGRLYHPHNARFETVGGRTGVLIERAGTTNKYSESASKGATWNAFQGSTVTVTPGQPDPFGGTQAYRVQTSGGTSDLKAYNIAGTPPNGVQWAGQIWVRNRISTPLTVSGDVGGSQASQVVQQSEGWVQIKWVVTGDGTAQAQHQLRAPTAGDIVDCDVCFLQWEERSYHTSWHVGETPRSPETLTIPTAGILDPNEGTIEIWIKPSVVADYNNFFEMSTSNGRFLLFFTSTGAAIFDYGPFNRGLISPDGAIKANQWHHIVLLWSEASGKQALFVDGMKYEQDLLDGVATSFPSNVSIVGNYSAYIDDLRISHRARTDEEIAAAYAAGFLEWDADTTLYLPFDGPDAQRSAKTVVI